MWPNHLIVYKQDKMLPRKIALGFIPCHPMWREAMRPSLDAADHRWRDVVIIDHHLSGMEVIPPRASMVRMRKILRVTRHRVHSRNPTLTAPLGSLCLGLVVVHDKTKAGGDGGNGGETVATAAATGGKQCGSSRRVASGNWGEGMGGLGEMLLVLCDFVW